MKQQFDLEKQAQQFELKESQTAMASLQQEVGALKAETAHLKSQDEIKNHAAIKLNAELDDARCTNVGLRHQLESLDKERLRLDHELSRLIEAHNKVEHCLHQQVAAEEQMFMASEVRSLSY